MKKKLLVLISSFVLSLPMFAAFYMCVKLSDSDIMKFKANEVKEVLYESADSVSTSKKTNMHIIQKDGNSVKYDVKNIEKVFYEHFIDSVAVDTTIIDTTVVPIVPDTTIIDTTVVNPVVPDTTVTDTTIASESPLRYQIQTNSTVSLSGYDQSYFIDEDGLILEKDIEVPAKVKIDGVTYIVTSVGKAAFMSCSGLTGIKLPSTITCIEDSAFHSCIGLLNIEIPSSVTRIGEESFINCTRLTNVTIPSSVTTIDGWAFYGCELLDVVVDNAKSNIEIGKDAFGWCKSVTYTIEETTPVDTTIVDNQLKYKITSDSTAEVINGCKESYIIPETVQIDGNTYTVAGIADFAFANCQNLRSIVLPDNIKYIGEGAFTFCYNLSSINIPAGVTSIADSAFASCKTLTTVDIPTSLEKIERSTFSGCNGLKNVTIPSNVKSIEYNAFSGCTNLDVVIDNSEGDVEVDLYALYDCKSVTYTIVDSTIVDAADTPLKFSKPYGSSVYVTADDTYRTVLDSVVIPTKVRIDGKVYTVNGIETSAFNGSQNLTNIMIPSTITSIGDTALTNCPKLSIIDVDSENPNYSSADGVLYNKDKTELITVGGGVRGELVLDSAVNRIKYEAFVNNKGLNKLMIQENVRHIDYRAFVDCDSLDVVIDTYQDSVYVEDNAFIGHKSLTWTKVDSAIVDSKDTPLNFNITSDSTAEVAESDKDMIYGAINIPAKVRINRAVYVVTGIVDKAFEKCAVMTDVSIPSTVTTIGNSAFNFCSGLANVTLSEGLISIGEEAFIDCTNLKAIEIPSTVTTIGNMAFAYDKNLNVVIKNKEENIEVGTNVFFDCKSVKYSE